jgi:hypothetical protein
MFKLSTLYKRKDVNADIQWRIERRYDVEAVESSYQSTTK